MLAARDGLDGGTKLLAIQVDLPQLLYGRFALLYGLGCLVGFSNSFNFSDSFASARENTSSLARTNASCRPRKSGNSIDPSFYHVGETVSSFSARLSST